MLLDELLHSVHQWRSTTDGATLRRRPSHPRHCLAGQDEDACALQDPTYRPGVAAFNFVSELAALGRKSDTGSRSEIGVCALVKHVGHARLTAPSLRLALEQGSFVDAPPGARASDPASQRALPDRQRRKEDTRSTFLLRRIPAPVALVQDTRPQDTNTTSFAPCRRPLSAQHRRHSLPPPLPHCNATPDCNHCRSLAALDL